jgi:hypothetical protein
VPGASNTARASEILASLLLEREALLRRPEEYAALEANRLAIVYWQARLSPLDGGRPEDRNRRSSNKRTAGG